MSWTLTSNCTSLGAGGFNKTVSEDGKQCTITFPKLTSMPCDVNTLAYTIGYTNDENGCSATKTMTVTNCKETCPINFSVSCAGNSSWYVVSAKTNVSSSCESPVGKTISLTLTQGSTSQTKTTTLNATGSTFPAFESGYSAGQASYTWNLTDDTSVGGSGTLTLPSCGGSGPTTKSEVNVMLYTKLQDGIGMIDFYYGYCNPTAPSSDLTITVNDNWTFTIPKNTTGGNCKRVHDATGAVLTAKISPESDNKYIYTLTIVPNMLPPDYTSHPCSYY